MDGEKFHVWEPFKQRPCPKCGNEVPSTLVFENPHAQNPMRFAFYDCVHCGRSVWKLNRTDIPDGRNNPTAQAEPPSGDAEATVMQAVKDNRALCVGDVVEEIASRRQAKVEQTISQSRKFKVLFLDGDKRLGLIAYLERNDLRLVERVAEPTTGENYVGT
jgi:hypothetical protein